MASCIEQELQQDSLFNFVVRDGNGVKGLVDSGLSKVPDRFIQPPKERIPEKISSNSQSIDHEHDQPRSNLLNAPIDLSLLDGPSHDQVAMAIVQASESLGFFQVVNHGVPVQLLESLKEAAHRFFQQPPETKAVYRRGASPSPFVKYGTSFVPDKEKALEWKDFLSMAYTTDEDALNHWPNLCKEVALDYLKTASLMVRKILMVLVGHLGVTAHESRADLIDALTGGKMVNMNFYPTCPNPDLTVGVGRHSDVGTLTVLLQDGIGGLYVKLEEVEEEEEGGKQKKGGGEPPQWMEVPPVTGALVINVGDTLQMISNGRYKSAEHRVRTTSKEARVSIPLFTSPLPPQKIGPLPHLVDTDGIARYRDLLFGDYANNFFGNAHEGKKSLDFAKMTDG